jgi:hypothetical protein
LWHGTAPDSARDWIGDSAISSALARVAGPHAPSAAELISNAWIIALRRWLRRYARIGLHDLVCRPGKISATRTHIDILLDLRQAELRVRRAGLDLDPGWVPWLGRVILFHYLDGEDTR